MATASTSSAAEPRLGPYLAGQLEARLRRVAFELRDARQSMEEENIHDLRVALRRLIEAIRASEDLVDDEGAVEVLKDLKKIMRAAGRVRGFDIAEGLLARTDAPADAPLFARIQLERTIAAADLYHRMQRAYQRNATAKWRAKLNLAGLAQ